MKVIEPDAARALLIVKLPVITEGSPDQNAMLAAYTPVINEPNLSCEPVTYFENDPVENLTRRLFEPVTCVRDDPETKFE